MYVGLELNLNLPWLLTAIVTTLHRITLVLCSGASLAMAIFPSQDLKGISVPEPHQFFQPGSGNQSHLHITLGLFHLQSCYLRFETHRHERWVLKLIRMGMSWRTAVPDREGEINHQQCSSQKPFSGFVSLTQGRGLGQFVTTQCGKI